MANNQSIDIANDSDAVNDQKEQWQEYMEDTLGVGAAEPSPSIGPALPLKTNGSSATASVSTQQSQSNPSSSVASQKSVQSASAVQSTVPSARTVNLTSGKVQTASQSQTGISSQQTRQVTPNFTIANAGVSQNASRQSYTPIRTAYSPQNFSQRNFNSPSSVPRFSYPVNYSYRAQTPTSPIGNTSFRNNFQGAGFSNHPFQYGSGSSMNFNPGGAVRFANPAINYHSAITPVIRNNAAWPNYGCHPANTFKSNSHYLAVR